MLKYIVTGVNSYSYIILYTFVNYYVLHIKAKYCTFVNMEQIRYIMEHYDLSATHLADKLGIQRSTISHLLSGRNNPSIDLLRRIITNFPDINEAWLLSGHGSPLKQQEKSTTVEVSDDSTKNKQDTFVNNSIPLVKETFVNSSSRSQDLDTNVNEDESARTNVNESEVEQILVFYRDGTFKYFRPRK